MNQKKKLSRKVISYVLTLVMVFSILTGIVPGTGITAQAASTELTAETTTWGNGDYVVPAGGLTISGHITVNGTVNLTLPAGTTLTANAGITLSDGATLNVSGEGAMTVNGTNNSTASTVAGNGTLVLTSGTLTAKGGNGQGIGDRQGNQTGANGGTAINGSVIVNGGTLTATGGNGGNVGGSCWKCKGGNGDAAISGNLTVNGGTMTATNGAAGSLGSRPIDSSAGAAGASIGGKLTLGKNVTLYDGLYNVLDDNNSSSREYNGDRTQIMHAVYEVTYAVTQITHTPAAAEGTVSMTYGDSSTLLPGETSLDDVKGKTVTLNITPGSGYRVKSVTVEKPAEATITLDNTTTGWRDGTYAVPAGGLTYSEAITVSGDVTLVLTDGETLTLNKGIGIAEGATLTIQGEGAMNINGTNSSTASTVAGCTGTLVLTGGTLTAKGGDGQGFSSFGDNRNGAVGGVAINGNVIIEGGTLTATGGNGGSMGSDAGPDNRGGNGGVAISGSLTINGGTVTTTNGSNGTNNTQSWEHSSAGSGGKAVAGTVTDNTGTNTETGGAGNESNPEETAAIIEAEKQTDGSWQFTMPDYSVTINIKYEEGADKTALNDAITAAKTLYNSIKDNTDYSDIASTFQTAINTAQQVADSDKADQDAVDAATSNITTAKTNAVIGIINALPSASDVTTADREVIETVREAYDALDNAQKALVDADTLKKLTDAEDALETIDQAAAGNVNTAIGNLPAATDVTADDRANIKAAREAYDALDAVQKALVDANTLKKLTDAEDALSTIDQAAAGNVNTAIGNLPVATDVTADDRADIKAAREAYNALDAAQKALVDANTLKKLTDAEDALSTIDQAAAGNVKTAIGNLPAATDVTVDSREAIETAREAYDALDEAQKKLVDEDTLKKLTDTEKALKDAEIAKSATDVINALPASDKVATTDKAAIEAARKAYDALTADQKKKVSADTLKKLTDAETALTAAEKKAAEEEAAKKKEEADTKAANAVVETINKLPVSNKVATTDKAAIEAARKAYDALTADQKKKVSADTLKKLTDAETALTAAEKKAAEDKAAAEKKAAEEKAARELAAAKQEAQAAMNEQVTVTQKGKKFTVKWKKSSVADGYYVYASYCGKKATKPAKTIKKNTTTKTTITKIDGKKISTKKNFHVYVVPYKIIDGKKVALGKSTVAHLVGVKSTKYSNVKKLTLTKKKYTVKVGKTAKIKAKVTLVNKNKKHIPKGHGAKFRYKSSDTSIATVDKNGKIKGIKKGTCTIYVYSINGLMKKAKVTIK